MPEGTSVLEAARALGVDLDSVCGGRGICGRCQVSLTEGHLAKLGIESSAEDLTPPNAVEARYGDKRGLAAGRRLGCQARLCGDAAIDVPAESQVHRQVVRKRAEAHPIAIDPVVTLHYVEVAEPDMHEPSSDLRRLQQALAAQWGLGELACGLAVLRGLQKILRAGGWRVTAAVRLGREIVAVYPGLHERVCGIAVDIGSTTIAAPSLRPRQRRGARLGRRDEPADPLRRRPHEPGLACDDEPGRRRRLDRRGARGGGWTGRHGRGRGAGPS